MLFAKGSVVIPTIPPNDRMQAAAVRCADAWHGISRRCAKISDEIDEVTMNGVPRTEIHEEDSIVTIVANALSETKKLTEPPPTT